MLDVKLARIILSRQSGEDIIHVHLLINLTISYYTNLMQGHTGGAYMIFLSE